MRNDVHSFTFTEKIRSVFALFILAIAFIFGGILAAVFGLLTFFQFTNFVVTTFGKMIGSIAFFLLGLKMKVVRHGELPAQVVYIFNHSSTLDIPITLDIGLKNTRYVAKYELLFNPVFAIVGLATGQVFINRGTSKKAIQSIQKAYKRIKEKKLNLVIAPEGTRKHAERIGKFKKGAFHTAKDLGYPIVPLYFENSWNLGPESALFFHRGTITVHIFEPISTVDWTKENLDEKVAEVRAKYVEWSKIYD